MDKIMLNVDPKWIKHIILNLLSNALKYSEAPASVIIEIRQEENEVILSVTDQGIGFSEKIKNQFLNPSIGVKMLVMFKEQDLDYLSYKQQLICIKAK